MNTQGALGVGLGHVLGGALWRWLNRDKSMFNKTKANGEPIESDDTSPEAGWGNQSQPTIWQKGIQDWENAKYNIVNHFAQQNYKEPNNLLPIGNFADNAVKPNYNLEDEWKGGILSGLGRL